MLAEWTTGAARDLSRIGAIKHTERRFGWSPSREQARHLLGELNKGEYRFTPPPPREPLVLYGAGTMGRLARDYLRAVGLDVQFVVDRNAASLRTHPFWSGTTLLAPEEASGDLKSKALVAVSVATCPFVPLEATLHASGWTDVVPFYDLAENYRDRHPLSNGWATGSLGPEDLDRTWEVLSGWGDSISRAHHLQFLAWRMRREEWSFDDAPVTLHDRFFIPDVTATLDATEMFVDCGAHHGDVTKTYVDISAGRFASILAIEPDADSRQAFERAMSALEPATAARISLMPHALDAEVRDRSFHDGLGYASQFAKTGSKRLRTRAIDDLGLSPTFIKLHLEGSERDALLGALATIRRHRPIIAATTYHNDDGIWRTPLFLMQHLDGYRFLMRLHSWCGTGAVVYAIPAERRHSST